MVFWFVDSVGSVYCVFVDMVITRGGSLSPSPKRSPSGNRHGSVKKKKFFFKAKEGNVGSELLKRKKPEDVLHRKKKKAKRAKLISKSVFSGIGGFSTVVASSLIVIKVLHNVFFFFC